jgi:hypothetical protein
LLLLLLLLLTLLLTVQDLKCVFGARIWLSLVLVWHTQGMHEDRQTAPTYGIYNGANPVAAASRCLILIAEPFRALYNAPSDAAQETAAAASSACTQLTQLAEGIEQVLSANPAIAAEYDSFGTVFPLHCEHAALHQHSALQQLYKIAAETRTSCGRWWGLGQAQQHAVQPVRAVLDHLQQHFCACNAQSKNASAGATDSDINNNNSSSKSTSSRKRQRRSHTDAADASDAAHVLALAQSAARSITTLTAAAPQGALIDVLWLAAPHSDSQLSLQRAATEPAMLHMYAALRGVLQSCPTASVAIRSLDADAAHALPGKIMISMETEHL